LIVCYSSIIRKASNADNQSQKTYVSHTKPKIPGEVYTLFQKKLQLYVDRATEFSKYCNKHVANKVILSSSSTSIQQKIDKEQIDLAVTSPPYIKAIDYIYNQMVELFWIGDLFEMQTQTKQNILKKKYIGNKQIPKSEFNNYNPNNTTFGFKEIDKALQSIFKTDEKNGHKHAYITYKYFSEMSLHFKEMFKVCKRGTPYIMVVGNSSVSNIIIKTDEFLTKIAEKEGFRLNNKWGYKIKNRFMRFNRKGRGGIIEIDWVLDFIRA